MKILVMSCDKCKDTFDIYKHCIDKYWPEHPEIYYVTETIDNPYYKTLHKNFDISMFTKRIYEAVKDIEDNKILLMCDDIFIRSRVDNNMINEVTKLVTGNIAAFNFQAPFSNDNVEFNSIALERAKDGNYKTSLMCQLWQRDKLLECLNVKPMSPGDYEYKNNSCGYDYLISKTGDILNFGRPNTGGKGAIYRGKGTRELQRFCEAEGITVDYSKRGFAD